MKYPLFLVFLLALAGCYRPREAPTPSQPPVKLQTASPSPAPTPGKDGYFLTPTGLKYRILRSGAGTPATPGRLVKVNYVGKLENGKVFDSSQKGQPFVFTLGNGEVISGWDEGVTGMRIGEKRKLVVPSKLAYGTTGASGVIPPNATLIFEIDLLGVN
jgi:FKBP-type peptidyl-prolyl cis-trans isomerase